MKSFILFAILVGIVSCKTRWSDLHGYTFEDYRVEYRKNYENANEVQLRREIFNEKLDEIRSHNADTTKSWKRGVNAFTDRTPEEFRQVLGLKKSLLYSTKQSQRNYKPSKIDLSILPETVDWRTQGVITDVKDQGECGSCWTFGTAETFESYWALETGELADMSEQQILDCTANPNQCGGTGGCQGGTPELAYAQIAEMGGLSSEWTYPYISYFGESQQCRSNATFMPIATLGNWTVLPSNEYEPVMQHLATTGPLAVNVDASAWQDYEEGVFGGCNQTNPDIDHVVQLVGYGTDPEFGDYWLVRNSWNPSWGEVGYIRLARQSKLVCGVDINPSDGTGCKNGPKTVVVCGECAILYDTSFPNVEGIF